MMFSAQPLAGGMTPDGQQDFAGLGRLPGLLLVLPAELPSATIYIIKPLTELARQKKLYFSVTSEADVTAARLRASDLVLFCRNVDPQQDWILDECLAGGIPTVYDLDDNFWEMPSGLGYSSYHQAPERIRQLERYLQKVDLVRVYSPRLVERAAQFNPNVSLATPCIDMGLVPRVALPKARDKGARVRMTYVTERGSQDSLISLFADDLLRLLEIYAGDLEMTWWGEVPDRVRFDGRRNGSRRSDGIRSGQPSMKQVNVIRDYDQFLAYLAHEGFDIGLAPLLPTPFYLAKTNTKFRDYGACRIAGIYSAVEVYSSCVEHGKTGLLVGDAPGAWFEAMQRLVLDSDLRESIQESAYQYVDQNYRQELAEQQWLEIIASLLQRPAWALASKRWIAPGVELGQPEKRPRLVQVSLGEEPPAGFIAVSEAPGPGIQVLVDFSQPLPFASDSIDELLADRCFAGSPSKKGVEGPEAGLLPADVANNILSEIYRSSKHGAQVCILARYSRLQGGDGAAAGAASLASAGFNEDTPWQWTPVTPPLADKDHLLVAGESLLRVDAGVEGEPRRVASTGLDLRCLRMELFYYPSYLSLPEEERRQLRRREPHVCEYILYHCLVVKPSKFAPAGSSAALELDHPIAESGLDTTSASDQRWLQDQAKQMIFIDPPAVALRRSQDLSEMLKDEIARAHAEIKKINQAKLELKAAEMNRQLPLARQAALELDALRCHPWLRLVERFIDRADYADQLSAAFQPAKDDSLIFIRSLKGYRLKPSLNLQRVPYLSYPLRLNRANLCQVCLAFLFDLFPSSGEISVEIVPGGSKRKGRGRLSSGEACLARATLPASQIRADALVCFAFSPVASSADGMLELRIRATGLDVPVRVYEWLNSSFFRLGPIRTRPFCHFEFFDQP